MSIYEANIKSNKYKNAALVNTRIEKYKELRARINREIQLEKSSTENNQQLENFKKRLLKINFEYFDRVIESIGDDVNYFSPKVEVNPYRLIINPNIIDECDNIHSKLKNITNIKITDDIALSYILNDPNLSNSDKAIISYGWTPEETYKSIIDRIKTVNTGWEDIVNKNKKIAMPINSETLSHLNKALSKDAKLIQIKKIVKLNQKHDSIFQNFSINQASKHPKLKLIYITLPLIIIIIALAVVIICIN